MSYTALLYSLKTDQDKVQRILAKLADYTSDYKGKGKMNRIGRKPAFCILENKSADQLCSNREADQGLCYRYKASS